MSERRAAAVGAMMVAVGPLSFALYTPAMPALVQAFASTPAEVKLTLTAYFLGFALAQLVCGPLSDAFGRRPVALAFFGLYFVGGVVAASAPTMDWLLAGRVLQGVGAAAGVAISRAMIRDQFTGQASARVMNLIGLMMSIGPALSPPLGGVILASAGWQAIFMVMVLCGLAALLVLVFAVPETNRTPDAGLARPAAVLRSYRTLLRDPGFTRFGLQLGMTFGGMYAMAAMLPFVLIDRVGLTPTAFGLVMLAQPLSYTAGNLITGRLLGRVDAMRLLAVGLVIVAAAGLAFAVVLRLLPASPWTVMAPVGLWAFGMALLMPGSTTGALAGHPTITGAASALAGFLQIGGGLAGSLVAALFSDPLAALMTVMPGMAAVALAVHFGLGGGPAAAAAPVEPTDIEVAVDPASVVGAGGEEIEAAVKRAAPLPGRPAPRGGAG